MPIKQKDIYVAGIPLRENLEAWNKEVMEMYLSKREEYGDSFSDSAKAFKNPEDDEKQAGLRLFLQREFDKLKRIHSVTNKRGVNDADPVIEDALRDIVGYVHVIRSYLLSQK